MKVTHVNTFDITGGASRATYRLHQALCRLGVDSKLVTLDRQSADPTVVQAPSTRAESSLRRAVFEYLQARRTNVSDCIFTVAHPGVDISALPEVADADIVNLHWVGQFLGPQSVGALLDQGKRLVWRLSDQWSFTGGCHYATGCTGYERDCSDCPQLAASERALPKAVFADRRRNYADRSMHIVSPSRWLAGCARRSALYHDKDIRVIPNGIDADSFSRVPGARKMLGLREDSFVLLFVAVQFDRRKGFVEMAESAARCLLDPAMAALAGEGRLELLCIGSERYSPPDSSLPFRFLGATSDNLVLRAAYSAADVFIIPSLEENFPSTVLEAMCCATPVIGFDSGGIPDIIAHGATGLVTPTGDVEALAQAILTLQRDPARRRAMGETGLARVRSEFSSENQTRRYLDLYAEILEQPALATQGARPSARPPAAYAALLSGARPLVREESAQSLAGTLERVFRHRARGEFAPAHGILDDMLARGFEVVEALRTKGGLYAAQGRFDDALACFNMCLAKRPGSPDLLANVSDALRMAGRFDEALAVLDDIERAEPGFSGLALKRARIRAAVVAAG
ncbi:MAG: hypothetical protein AUJ49_01195 [Desulfovibrionaceae bacterium CG1_02_65_16]|nr:MAG: hypothetical protein AUJ49_01195 [Desulfovibrionaceae bacterium CG1_02_65_16]